MKIYQSYTFNHRPAFGTKFLKSESLKQIADYAVEHGKFDKLNEARKNIERANLQTRLRVDIGETEKGMPFVTFTRFVPKPKVLVAYTMDDYQQSKVTLIESSKKVNVLKFALEKIIKMGNNAPKNNLYQRAAVKK